ncbi:SBBP repeat-containing protein [bacterium]|nr:SBBP repeat-containing protein [bacterium]
MKTFYRFLTAGICVVLVSLFSGCTSSNSAVCSSAFSGIRQIGVTSLNVWLYGSALDSECNLYITGFVNADLNGETKTGDSDMFVVKYDKAGDLQWTRLLGAASQVVYGYSVATGPQGAVYVTGLTTGALADQSMTGTQDLFVAKYNTDGDRLWVRMSGVVSNDTFGYDLATDVEGNLFVTGQTWGDLDGNTRIGSEDGFLMKYDADGNKAWTQTLGAASAFTNPGGVRAGASGAVYIAGYTSGSLPTASLTGTMDAFVAKYDTDGNVTWIKQLGLSGSATNARSLAVDVNENIFLAGVTDGAFEGTLTGTQDLFIAKYDASGTVAWTHQLGASGSGILMDFNSAGVDAEGNVYVGACTSQGIDGNSLVGTLDLFITKYSSAGVKQWTRETGATGHPSRVLSLPVSLDGNVFATGITDGGMPGQTLIGDSDSYIVPFDKDGNQL